MKTNFDKFFEEILKSEGGYVDDPNDPGGATNMGVTINTLRAWRGQKVTKADVKNLEVSEVQDICKKNYWDAVKADDLPSGVDVVVADFAYHSGPHRAAISLQEVLGVGKDGKVGPMTLQAAATSRPQSVIMEVSDNRMDFLQGLSTWPLYGNGWEKRVRKFRTLGLQLAEEASPTPEPSGKDSSVLTIIGKIIAALMKKN